MALLGVMQARSWRCLGRSTFPAPAGLGVWFHTRPPRLGHLGTASHLVAADVCAASACSRGALSSSRNPEGVRQEGKGNSRCRARLSARRVHLPRSSRCWCGLHAAPALISLLAGAAHLVVGKEQNDVWLRARRHTRPRWRRRRWRARRGRFPSCRAFC